LPMHAPLPVGAPYDALAPDPANASSLFQALVGDRRRDARLLQAIDDIEHPGRQPSLDDLASSSRTDVEPNAVDALAVATFGPAPAAGRPPLTLGERPVGRATLLAA